MSGSQDRSHDSDDAAGEVERELDLRAEMPFVDSEAELTQLLTIARQVQFRAGDHLFELGAPIERLYFITSGDVELVMPGQPGWRMGGSSGVGFLDFMMGRCHSRTCIARGDVRALEIDAADYGEYMQDHVDMATRTLSELSEGLFDEILASSEPAAMLAQTAAPQGSGSNHGGELLVERLLLLSRVPAFERASVQALANLAQKARVIHHAPGREIVTAGVRYDSISILIRGQVELGRVGHPPIRRGGIDLLCHVAELAAVPRRVSVRTVEACVVMRIDREELLDRMDEHFEVTRSLFAWVARERERLNNVSAAAGQTL